MNSNFLNIGYRSVILYLLAALLAFLPSTVSAQIPGGDWGLITSKREHSASRSHNITNPTNNLNGSFTFTLDRPGSIELYGFVSGTGEVKGSASHLTINGNRFQFNNGNNTNSGTIAQPLGAGTYTIAWRVEATAWGTINARITVEPGAFPQNIPNGNWGTITERIETSASRDHHLFAPTNNLNGTFTFTLNQPGSISLWGFVSGAGMVKGSASHLTIHGADGSETLRFAGGGDVNSGTIPRALGVGTYTVEWRVEATAYGTINAKITIEPGGFPPGIPTGNWGTITEKIEPSASIEHDVFRRTNNLNGTFTFTLDEPGYIELHGRVTGTGMVKGSASHLTINGNRLQFNGGTNVNSGTISQPLDVGTYSIEWRVEATAYGTINARITIEPGGFPPNIPTGNWGTITGKVEPTASRDHHLFAPTNNLNGNFTFTLDRPGYIGLYGFVSGLGEVKRSASHLTVNGNRLQFDNNDGFGSNVNSDTIYYALDAGTYTIEWRVEASAYGTINAKIIIDPGGFPPTIPDGNWGTITEKREPSSSRDHHAAATTNNLNGSFTFTLDRSGYIALRGFVSGTGVVNGSASHLTINGHRIPFGDGNNVNNETIYHCLDPGTYTVEWRVEAGGIIPWGTINAKIIIDPGGFPPGIPSGNWGTITEKREGAASRDHHIDAPTNNLNGSFTFTLDRPGLISLYGFVSGTGEVKRSASHLTINGNRHQFDNNGSLGDNVNYSIIPRFLDAGTYTVEWRVEAGGIIPWGTINATLAISSNLTNRQINLSDFGWEKNYGWEDLAKNAGSDSAMRAAAARHYFDVDDEWHDDSWEGTGLNAYGLVSENNALLVFRGTENMDKDLKDTLSDAHPLGVGYNQYIGNIHDNRSRIRRWVTNKIHDGKSISVTGHSLGGALAQHFAVDWTSNVGGRVASLVTFQAAGISATDAGRFNAGNCDQVIHHIAAGDLVSLAGTFVQKNSSSYRFYEYIGDNTNPLFFQIPGTKFSNKGIHVDGGNVHGKWVTRDIHLFRYLGDSRSAEIGVSFNNPGYRYGEYAGILSTQHLLDKCEMRLQELQEQHDSPGRPAFGDPSRYDDQLHMDAVRMIREMLGSRANFENFRKNIFSELLDVIGGLLTGGQSGVHPMALLEELSQVFGRVIAADTPVIDTQPQSATYTQGAIPTALSVEARGNGTLSYQWYGSGSSSVLSTSPTYTPSTATVGSAGYYVVVTNSLNGTLQAATSNTATITVNAVPMITEDEFDTIRSQYPDLKLSADIADYNIRVIKTDQLSQANLQNAINAATTGNNLVVLRTTATQNSVMLTGTPLSISSENVTIVSLGTERMTLNANRQSRALTIGSNATVNLAGLDIVNGNAGLGGAILSDGSLTITDCTFDNNSGDTGGAVFASGDFSITSAAFTNNIAINGGAIFVSMATLSIDDSTFEDNFALLKGGAIYGEESVMTFTRCEISWNHAGNDGGGIYNHNGTATAIDTIFEGNTPNNIVGVDHECNFEWTYTDPTCTKDGYSTGTCTVCGEVVREDDLDTAGHDYEWTYTDPTCSEDGYWTYTCTDCGDVVYEIDEGSACCVCIPVNLRVVQRGQNAVSLQWNAVHNATGYIVERECPDAGIEEFYTDVARFVDTGLVADTTYVYSVRTLTSDFSMPIFVTTLPSATTDVPIILDTSVNELGQTTIVWTDLGEDYTYTIFRQGQIIARDVSGTSFFDANPPASWGVLEYGIRAFNESTQDSARMVTTTVWNTNIRSVEFTGFEITENGVQLFWNAAPDTEYQIMRLGTTLGRDVTSGWTDTSPMARNDYVLMAFYEVDGRPVRTYSDVFTVHWMQP